MPGPVTEELFAAKADLLIGALDRLHSQLVELRSEVAGARVDINLASMAANSLEEARIKRVPLPRPRINGSL